MFLETKQYLCYIKAGTIEEKTMKATDISSFFITKGVTPLKLQKLLFYSQVWYFIKHGKLLFNDEIQAWVLGPVVPNVWDKFRFIRRGDVINRRYIQKEIADSQVVNHLNEVWRVYGGYTGLELVDLTHDEKLWIDARGGIPDGQSSRATIVINDETTAYLRLDEQGNIPQVDKKVKGIAEFSGNVGEELF